MISKNIKQLWDYYTMIENDSDAINSPEISDCHHRLGVSESKSRIELINENKYYHRPPEELIFLKHSDHSKLSKNKIQSKENHVRIDIKSGDINITIEAKNDQK